MRDGDLAPAYYQHPVYLSRVGDEEVFPIAIYMDACPYTKGDGVLNVVVINQASERRHLIAALRMSLMCRS